MKHAIVCGHSDCGAMKAALDHRSLENLPKAQRWLDHVEAAYDYRQPLNAADGDGAELASLIRGNVVAQLHESACAVFRYACNGRRQAQRAWLVLRHP